MADFMHNRSPLLPLKLVEIWPRSPGFSRLRYRKLNGAALPCLIYYPQHKCFSDSRMFKPGNVLCPAGHCLPQRSNSEFSSCTRTSYSLNMAPIATVPLFASRLDMALCGWFRRYGVRSQNVRSCCISVITGLRQHVRLGAHSRHRPRSRECLNRTALRHSIELITPL
jgi:hypothetical protein